MSHRLRNVRYAVIIYKAFSLIEILISIALSTIILFSVASLYSQLYKRDKQDLERTNLQMQAHQLIDYLKHHLQHSGYLGDQRKGTNYNKFLINNKSYYITNNCILFFYDVNRDGDIKDRTEPNEIFGFKFTNNEIYKIKISYQNYIRKKDMICNSDDWQSIASDFQFIVNNLKFTKQSENLIKINIALGSRKYPMLSYQVIAYTYLFNGHE